MRREDIIRAWREGEALEASSDLAKPENLRHPAGEIELTEFEAAGAAAAGLDTSYVLTMGCCNGLTTPTCFCTVNSQGCACPPPDLGSCLINTCPSVPHTQGSMCVPDKA